MSSEFHHAEANDGWVKRPTGEYKIAHGEQIADENLSTLEKFFGYKAISQAGLMERNGGGFIDFSFTKNVAFMAIGVVILMLIFLPVAASIKRNKGKAPKGLQNLVEPLFEFIRDDIVIPNVGEKHYKKYLPFIMSLFFFIWIVNLLGLVPTGANASGNIAFTFSLAFITLLVTVFSGNKDYWMHILWTPGVPLPLRIIMLPVELLGIFTKPFALMIRLFANITAGHIIILSLVSFIFLFKNMALGAAVGPVIIAMTFLELFVAALQAYVFALLAALFIGLAVAEHNHEEAH
jgi:F-type H+-transporting ATPase subunit a